jgi:polyisoprenoid-binding protein YceI
MRSQQWERGKATGSVIWLLALALFLGFGLSLALFSRFSSMGNTQQMATASAAATPPATKLSAIDSAALAGAAVRLVVAPSGNEVRYRVREQLARVNLPNDAIGKTNAVTGEIAFDSSGKVITDASRFVIDASSLQSDRERRDGYVRTRTLETAQYPAIVFRPVAVQGLTWPLPTQGTDTFQLRGDLTIKGVTRPTVWFSTAHFADSSATGTAGTAFNFADFQLAQPRVPVVLSVADTIRLEYDFDLKEAGGR